MKRLLAVSHAFSKSVNRAAYRRMAVAGWDVTLVAPSSKLNEGHKSDARADSDPVIYFLPFIYIKFNF